MQVLRRMDPELYHEVLRRRARVWNDLTAWIKSSWQRTRARRTRWQIEIPILLDEVLNDLGHGRE